MPSDGHLSLVDTSWEESSPNANIHLLYSTVLLAVDYTCKAWLSTHDYTPEVRPTLADFVLSLAAASCLPLVGVERSRHGYSGVKPRHPSGVNLPQ